MQNVSKSISVGLLPYQSILSASTHQQNLGAARNLKNPRSHSSYLNFTSHGNKQLGHQTVDHRIRVDIRFTGLNLNPG